MKDHTACLRFDLELAFDPEGIRPISFFNSIIGKSIWEENFFRGPTEKSRWPGGIIERKWRA
jgi:hypothetical protein